MKSKTVFMACANYWNSPLQVGSQHIAQGFLQTGWKVAYISDPISPFHLFKAKTSNFRDRFALYRSGGTWSDDMNFWTYVPGSLITPTNMPMLRSRFVNNQWQRLTWPNIIELIKKKGFGDVDILYIDSVMQAFWLKALTYKKSVFRVADNQAGFLRTTPEMQRQEKKIAASVDLVVYTAKELNQHVTTFQPKDSLHFPNGVNFKHFAHSTYPKPADLRTIANPIAIYVGAMDVWFDYELLNYTASQLHNVNFVLIGPSEMAQTHLKKLPNIHILGRRSYDEIPFYLLNADVGIIPFNEKGYPTLINSVNPLKLYEYFACGLPVVSIAWKELYNLASPAILCYSANEFVEGIVNAISKQNDRETFKEYAKTHDWSSRVKNLIDSLFDEVNGD